MNDQLRSLFDQLKTLGGGSKAVALLVAFALVGIASVAAVVGNKPHFESLYSGLDANESAKVQKALSEERIPFEVSQPPGPFTVFVESDNRYRAMHVVASSDALHRAAGGILSSGAGLSSVFMSSGEREQIVRKREWQEMERLLEELDFIVSARVRTSGQSRSLLDKGTPTTGSVTLQLRSGQALSREQAMSVASLTRFGLGIAPENLMISDQSGNSLYDGNDLSEPGGPAGDWLEHSTQFDRDMEALANQVLSDILGPNKARVTVASTWNFDRQTTVSETSDPKKKVLLNETRSSTQTPQGSGGQPGGAVGSVLSLPGDNWGVDQAGISEGGSAPAAAGVSAEIPMAETEDSTAQYYTPRTTTHTVRNMPTLERLSVSFFLDESMAERQAELESAVQAAVGFDADRNDMFQAVLIPFALPEAELTVEGADPGAEAVPTEPAESGPSMLETLLEKGVEIVAALAFVIILLKSLKGSKKAVGGSSGENVAVEPEIDPDLLARRQVDELIKSDPDEVGRILSSWAASERTPVGSA